MRVLLVSSADGMRGGERQTLELGERLGLRGIEVAWAVRRNSALARRLPPAYSAVSLPFETIPLFTPLALRSFISRVRPDIVHAQTSRAHTHALIACRGGPPLVVSRRVAFTGGGPLDRIKYGSAVARFLPISRAAAVSLTGRGVPEERMTLVPSGVDTARFAAARRDELVRAALGGDGRTILAGTVAAFEAEKGLETLIEAAALLRRRVPSVRFVAAGEGRLEGRLRAEISRKGLTERMRLAPPPADLATMLAALDIFVLPSIAEGLSTALIAAAAAGLPCIASAAGGIPEVIGNGAGILVRPGDPRALAEGIERLVGDGALRIELGRRAGERAREFDIGKTVDLTIAVYRSVAGHGADG